MLLPNFMADTKIFHGYNFVAPLTIKPNNFTKTLISIFFCSFVSNKSAIAR